MYGDRLNNSTTNWNGHLGVDFPVAEGTAVNNVWEGWVVQSGVVLKDSPSHTGTARGGGSNYIILSTSASSSSGYYNSWCVYLTGGKGNGQSRQITNYDGVTKTAYFGTSDAWQIIPDTTTTYRVAEYRSYGEYIDVELYTGHWARYAHLKRRDVYVGSWASTGQTIGLSGKTGTSGPHLHFEIRKGVNNSSNVRNPEGYFTRSNQSGWGAVRGLVKTPSGTPLKPVVGEFAKILGASRPNDPYYNGEHWTYGVNQGSGGQFGDVADYGINYYIGCASTGSVALKYYKGFSSTTPFYTMNTTIDSGVDKLLSSVIMP